MISKADLFARALEQPVARRAQFVRRAARQTPELVDEVLSLLRAHANIGEFLDTDSAAERHADAAPRPEPDRDAVPGHELIRKLGEGGFGIVHLARELGTLKRQVAVKFLKSDRLSPGALERFDAERQILAGLEHEGIARIYTAGTAAEGCPYYTMEWVDGLPIDQHGDTRRLTIRERVDLFLHVCRAVAHAHQRGVIHGDLKPHNILVRSAEGECSASPKIIDFGIARMLGETPVGSGSTAGTPRYMSPEQLAGRPADTRCDVFALGVLLHELLIGKRTSDVTDTEAPMQLAAAAFGDEAATLRSTSPRRLRGILHGDLSGIVARATRTDPERRYATVRELILDLEAWRTSRPLPSRPRTLRYVLRRFLARHRLSFGVLLAASLTALGFGVHGVQRDRQAARAEAAAAESALRAAEFDRAAGEALSVLEQLIWSAAPEERGRDVTLGEVVDEAYERLLERSADSPLVDAQLSQTVGRLLVRTGRYREAEAMLRRSLELLESQPYPDRLAKGRLYLAGLLIWTGTTDERRELLQSARAQFERAGNAAGRLAADLELALVERDEGDSAKCIEQLRATHRHALEVLGPEHATTRRAGIMRAGIEIILGNREATEELRTLLNQSSADTDLAGLYASLHARISLARAHAQDGELDAARELANDVLADLARRSMPGRLTHGLAAKHVLMMVASRERDHETALRHGREILEARLQNSGPESRRARRAASNVAAMLVNLGRFEEATEVLDSHAPVPLDRTQLDTLDIEILRVRANLLRRAGKHALALEIQARIISACEGVYGKDGPSTLDARQRHAITLSIMGRNDEALAEFVAIRSAHANARGALHSRTLAIDGLIARIYVQTGKQAAAAELLQTRLDTALEAHGPAHGATVAAFHDHGAFCREFDRLDDFRRSADRIATAYRALRLERPEDEALASAQQRFEQRRALIDPR